MTEKVTIHWRHGGHHVLLAGTFSEWVGFPMSYSDRDEAWYDTITLNKGEQYQYKFIVDGHWRYDPDGQIIDDQTGNINNFINVGELKQQSTQVKQLALFVAKPAEKGGKQADKSTPTAGTKETGEKRADKREEKATQPEKGADKRKQADKGGDKGKQEEKGGDKGKQAEKVGDKGKQTEKGRDKGEQAEKGADKGKAQKDKADKTDKADKATKKEEDPMHLVGHWEKIFINTVTGKESWWKFVYTSEDHSKLPLRRRYPPDCVSCGEAVLVEDDVFSRYGVEWQPLCLRCYSSGVGVSLVNIGKVKPTTTPYCHWCHSVDNVSGQSCADCESYYERVSKDFGMSRNEAFTNLYYYMSDLRKQRPIGVQHK